MRSQMCTSQYIWLTEPLLGSTWLEWNNKYGVYWAPTVSPPRNSLTNLNQKSNRVKYEMWSEQKNSSYGAGSPGPRRIWRGKRASFPPFLVFIILLLASLPHTHIFLFWLGGFLKFSCINRKLIFIPQGLFYQDLKSLKTKIHIFLQGLLYHGFMS